MESGLIPGMFLIGATYRPGKRVIRRCPNSRTIHISSQGKVDEFRNKALELMDEGKKVVIGYESLAIGGSEGYVTMMVKDGDS